MKIFTPLPIISDDTRDATWEYSSSSNAQCISARGRYSKLYNSSKRMANAGRKVGKQEKNNFNQAKICNFSVTNEHWNLGCVLHRESTWRRNNLGIQSERERQSCYKAAIFIIYLRDDFILFIVLQRTGMKSNETKRADVLEMRRKISTG